MVFQIDALKHLRVLTMELQSAVLVSQEMGKYVFCKARPRKNASVWSEMQKQLF